MTIGELREEAYRANMTLAGSGLVMGTFGNLSVVDRALGLIAIKPSGVPYDVLTADKMVTVRLDSGLVVGSPLRPSSDTPTHLELYRAFNCGAIAHTHSEYATLFAQARTPIRCMGTTHADYFRGDIPTTRPLTEVEVRADYERHTGLVIVETFRTWRRSPTDVPAVLVANHAPFTWGATADEALEHARVLEFVARVEYKLLQIAPNAPFPDPFLVDRHFLRKHGPGASYGQQ
jgi:L-ribulose-5-phosphate 4-epimerase